MASMLRHDFMLLARIVLFLIYYKECKQFLNISNNSTWKKILAIPVSSPWINFIEGLKKKKKKNLWNYLNQTFLDTVQQKWNTEISKMEV